MLFHFGWFAGSGEELGMAECTNLVSQLTVSEARCKAMATLDLQILAAYGAQQTCSSNMGLFCDRVSGKRVRPPGVILHTNVS